MNLLTYFYERNKGLLITVLVAIISILLALVINIGCLIIVIGNDSLSNSLLVESLTHLSILGLIGLAIILTIIVGVINFINMVGKRREDLIKYYGKQKYLIYTLRINFASLIVLYTILIITITYNNIYQFVMYDDTLRLTVYRGQTQSYAVDNMLNIFNVFKHTSFFIITVLLIALGSLYCFLNLRNLLFNTQFKYKTKKKKLTKLFLRLGKYITLGFFVLFSVIMYTGLYTAGFKNFMFNSLFLRINISGWIVVAIVAMAFIIVLLDYVKIFKDEGML